MLKIEADFSVAPRHQVAVDGMKVTRWHAVERFMSLPPGWQIMRDADLAWLSPTPSFEWYRRFYNESYVSESDGPASPDTATFRERRIAYFSARLRRAVDRLGRTPDSILEIGSGDGLFLLAAKRMGLAATGTEICAAAAEKARAIHGVEILHGDLLRSDLPVAQQYDIVVLNHVLEHLVNPLDYLTRIRELLSPDGLLVFEIPQQFVNPIDLIYRAVGIRRPLNTYTLHHPYFYTVASIRRLMEVSAFRVERLVTWLPGQVFHIETPWITRPLSILLWLADKLALRGHIIEVFATPK